MLVPFFLHFQECNGTAVRAEHSVQDQELMKEIVNQGEDRKKDSAHATFERIYDAVLDPQIAQSEDSETGRSILSPQQPAKSRYDTSEQQRERDRKSRRMSPYQNVSIQNIIQGHEL